MEVYRRILELNTKEHNISWKYIMITLKVYTINLRAITKKRNKEVTNMK